MLANVEIRPPDQADPPTTSTPSSIQQATSDTPPLPPAAPRTSSTASSVEGSRLLGSLKGRDGKTKAGTSHTVLQPGEQGPDNELKAATEDSLWDRAYDALKNEKSDRMTKYEGLLSRVLVRGRCSLSDSYLSRTAIQ